MSSSLIEILKSPGTKLDNLPVLAGFKVVERFPGPVTSARVTSSPESDEYAIADSTGVITLAAILTTGQTFQATYTHETGVTNLSKCPVWVLNADGEAIAISWCRTDPNRPPMYPRVMGCPRELIAPQLSGIPRGPHQHTGGDSCSGGGFHQTRQRAAEKLTGAQKEERIV